MKFPSVDMLLCSQGSQLKLGGGAVNGNDYSLESIIQCRKIWGEVSASFMGVNL